MGFVVKLLGWWSLEAIIQAVMWGMVGYVIFRLCRGTDDKWLLGVLGTFLVFLTWNVFFTNSMLRELEISIGNEQVLSFFGGEIKDLFDTGPSDVIIAFVQVLLGFKVAQVLFKKVELQR